MKINVDREICMGHGMCNAMAAEVFEISDDGFNEMGTFEVPAGKEATATRGARACPEQAIQITREDQGSAR